MHIFWGSRLEGRNKERRDRIKKVRKEKKGKNVRIKLHEGRKKEGETKGRR